MVNQEANSKIGELESNKVPEDITLKCSCSACDSIACFAKRQLKKICSYEECIDFDTNVFNDDLNKLSMNIKFSAELVENKVKYENDKANRVIKKKDSKITVKRSQVLFSINPKNASDEMAMERDNEMTNLPNTNPSQKSCSVTAQLSAQIMNVPYENFEESCNRSEPVLNFPTLSPFDIFQKIKEVYKACSCKVCDCIVGNNQRNEFCKCKPCDCDDCKSFNRKIVTQPYKQDQINSRPVECTFSRCERPYSRIYGAATKISSPQDFDCGPSDIRGVFKTCDCEPCQCIECRMKNMRLYSPRNLVVAAVGDDNQTTPCQCSPCDCIECSHGFSARPTPLRHEMATGLDRHPQCRCDTCANDACLPDENDTCRCERRNKIVRKPVTSENHDYDIRTAFTHEMYVCKGRDALTMFAAVNNNYPTYDSNMCKCNRCECLNCIYKEDNAEYYDMKSSKKLIACGAVHNFNHSVNTSKCKCTKCKHEFCTMKLPKLLNTSKSWKTDRSKYEELDKPANNTTFKRKIEKSFISDCSFAPRECTGCERVKNRCRDDICQCAICKCKNCIDNEMSEVIYPVKKGERLAPETFENQNSDLAEFSAGIGLEHIHRFDSKIKQSDANNKQYETWSRIETVKQKLLDMEQKDLTANVRYINKGSIDLPNSPSILSGNTSYYLRDSGSISPLSGCGKKSLESSCNSSGHDYPNYIVQFPKNTVDTCLNDVMNLNLQSNISDERLDITSNMKPSRKAINIKTPTLCEFEKYNPVCARLIKSHVKNDKLSYDECSSIDGKSLCSEQTNQCEILINKEDSKRNMSAAQLESHCSRSKRDNGRLIDYNKYFEDTQKEFSQENYHNRKHRQLTTNHDFSLDKDYNIRVQKTLEDARKFSRDLIKLLEKYEKANREFKSVSKKFKYPDNCNRTLGNDIKYNEVSNFIEGKYLDTTTYKYLIDNVPTKENVCKIADNADPAINDGTKKVDETICDGGDEVIIVQCKKDRYNLNSNTDENPDTETKFNHYENNLNPIIEEKEPSPERSSIRQLVTKGKGQSYNQMYKRAVNVLKKPKVCKPRIANSSASTETSNGILSQEDYIDKKSSQLNKPNNNIQPKKEKDIEKCNTLENNNKSVNAVIEKALSEKTVNKTASPIEVENVNYIPEDNCIHWIKPPAEITHTKTIEQTQQFPTLKKIFCIHADNQFNMKEVGRQSLEIADIKKEIRSISWDSNKQPTTADHHHENKTLVNHQLEVNKILKLPKYQNLDVEYNNNMKKASNSGLDDLKVSLLRVQRVSDHTMMIKWNLPRALKYVDGYELLLDGRPVQKILNAKRCMAVITCLPNVAQLLLTVRTVTDYMSSAGHSPAATIIYRPREKSSGPQFVGI